ncbi:MAG: hypothetical protein QXX20_00970 [Candidatus Thermoplasmatota archaeon]
MSAFIRNNLGVMDLTLTTIGLMIAVAILLTAVVTFLSHNDTQRRMELENVASHIVTLVQAMDAKFLENTTTYVLPDLGYEYTVSISTEYVTVSAKGFYNNELSVKERFIVKPWVQDSSESTLWIGNTIHAFLEANPTYAHAATRDDPIQRQNIWTALRTDLQNQQMNNRQRRAEQPLLLTPGTPVIIDKTILHFNQPEGYQVCRFGKEYTNFSGEVEIIDGTIVRLSSFIGDGKVTYSFSIPYSCSDIQQVAVSILYKADGLMDPGPKLTIKNWIQPSNFIVDGLGFSAEYIWFNRTLTEPEKYVHHTSGEMRISLEITGLFGGINSDVKIQRVCVKATPTVTSCSDTQEFVFLYQHP